MTQVKPNPTQDTWSITQAVRLLGCPNCRQSSRSQVLKQSTSVYLKLYEIWYHPWILSMSSRTMDLRSTVRYQEYTAKLSRIGKTSKVTSTYQTHQYQVPSLSWACLIGIDHGISYWYKAIIRFPTFSQSHLRRIYFWSFARSYFTFRTSHRPLLNEGVWQYICFGLSRFKRVLWEDAATVTSMTHLAGVHQLWLSGTIVAHALIFLALLEI
jgi:hypothetical protein